jgi:signal transduction histidine kinase
LLATIPPILILGGITTAVVGTLVAEVVSDTIAASARAELHSQTDRLERFLGERRSYLEIIARSDALKSGDLSRIKAHLQREHAFLDHAFERLNFNALDGTVHPSVGATFNVADRPYWQRVQRGEVVMGELVISRGTQRRIALIIVPIRSAEGRLVGALAGTALIDETLASIASSTLALDSISGLVSSQGEVLAGSPITAALASTETEWAQRSDGTESRRIQLDDGSYIAWASTVRGPNWRYIIAWPEDSLFGPSRTLRLIVLTLVLLAVIGALIAASALRRGLARPVNEITNALNRYAEDPRVRSPANGPTELARLADTFNAVADRLEAETHARQKLEAELAQNQRLESVGRLAGGIAHDFNNLLTIILTLIDLVKSQVQDEAIRADLDAMNEAGQQAAGLTAQLLAFARRGHRQSQVIVIDDLITSLTGVLRRLLPESVTLDIRPSAPGARVDLDPTELMQVLINLCINARDAMPSGGPVTITTSLENQTIVIAVADRGTGIPAETLPHIFEPFFTTKELGRGTGLGLATCFGIVTRAGGTIHAESTIGTGTTFLVRLPTTDRALSKAVPVAPAQASAKQRILLVEDEALVRETTRLLLERSGHIVVTADSAASARARLDDTFDLLLTDLMMPGENGASLATWALETYPRLRVVMMSGFFDAEDLTTLEADPRVAFIAKPFEPNALLGKLHAASS